MVKRSDAFTDETSKDTGASSKSKPVGKRVRALAAVRRERSSPLIIVQEKTQSDVEGQVTGSGSVTCGRFVLDDAKKECNMLRRHLFSTSPIIPMSRHRETSCSQQKMLT